MKIYLLENGQSVESKTNLIFPNLPIRELPKLIEEHRSQGRRMIRQAVKDWVK